ncbi:FadR/GntR family transcriptional regulator [Nocardioides daeguensis]|uniref:FadR/GntR family transcriptional regulator n=1 Tax=Nocardioides daeguensis TaxID=908359 RepID=A0ABP6VN27_9ACTN|nr:FadR/GntR family transcriptional regulator [Nocardioides daeguensis]MBV6729013.1 FadR family transcriptional regulator [Nocardioides daeguensis]MCR1773534.1 FadR family transcriptional regulator [Nocardioides daeguensis]
MTSSPDEARPRFTNVTPVRAYESVVAQIENAVFAGQLVPGDRLPSERELMAQFGVSRGTVREALRVLESGGIIRSRPGDPGGATVQANSSARLAKALTTFVKLGQIGVGELIEFRMVVEGSAVRLAAELHDDETLAAMEDAFADMKRAADVSFEDFSAADVSFHLAVAACSGNSLFSACSQFARDTVLQLTTDNLKESGDPTELIQETLRRHGAYLQAIRDRDGRTAEALARQDLVDYYGPHLEADERARIDLLLMP